MSSQVNALELVDICFAQGSLEGRNGVAPGIEDGPRARLFVVEFFTVTRFTQRKTANELKTDVLSGFCRSRF